MQPTQSDRLDPPFWDHQRHVLRQLRLGIEKALAPLGPGAGRRIIDLGCGDRPYASLLRKRGFDYVACDIEGDVDVRLVPGERMALDDASADVVVSFQVLEHVWDLDWYLGEARRILRPGGYLLLTTHGSWPYHPHPTDFRRWTRDGLVGELESRRFRIEQVDSVVGLLALTTQYRLVGIRHALLAIPPLAKVVVPLVASVMNAQMLLEDAITPRAIRDANACIYVTLSRPIP